MSSNQTCQDTQRRPNSSRSQLKEFDCDLTVVIIRFLFSSLVDRLPVVSYLMAGFGKIGPQGRLASDCPHMAVHAALCYDAPH